MKYVKRSVYVHKLSVLMRMKVTIVTNDKHVPRTNTTLRNLFIKLPTNMYSPEMVQQHS